MIEEYHRRFYYKDGKLFNKDYEGKANCVKPNKEVGTVNSKGYKTVQLNLKTHSVHRIIWEMHNGVIPDGMQIDHINGNRLDNGLDNLRLVDNQINSMNMKRYKNNSTGVTGVSVSRGKFKAKISKSGKDMYLGVFDTLEQAAYARKIAEVALGFHNNHGRVV